MQINKVIDASVQINKATVGPETKQEYHERMFVEAIDALLDNNYQDKKTCCVQLEEDTVVEETEDSDESDTTEDEQGEPDNKAADNVTTCTEEVAENYDSLQNEFPDNIEHIEIWSQHDVATTAPRMRQCNAIRKSDEQQRLSTEEEDVLRTEIRVLRDAKQSESNTCPKLKLVIESKDYAALTDTGSMISILTRSIYEDVKKNLHKIEELPATRLKIYGAFNSKFVE